MRQAVVPYHNCVSLQLIKVILGIRITSSVYEPSYLHLEVKNDKQCV
jgi:hypothetical protein